MLKRDRRRRAENKTSKGKVLPVIAGNMGERWDSAEKEGNESCLSSHIFSFALKLGFNKKKKKWFT